MAIHPLVRRPLVPFAPRQRPQNHDSLGVTCRLGTTIDDARSGEQARSAALALVEAVLFAADEPLPSRRLAAAAGLTNVAEARRLVQRLRELYAADGSAFTV